MGLFSRFRHEDLRGQEFYCIVGLGNPGRQYEETKHNVGFKVIDRLAEKYDIKVEKLKNRALVGDGMIRNKRVLLVKPQTYMNLSGNAVRYWMTQEKIPLENVLVLVDDLALPFGSLRLKSKGSSAGHNGLGNIQALLGTDAYARLRFGLGNNYARGGQIDFVLGKFTSEEQTTLPARIDIAIEIIKSFCLAGINITMNQFNNK